MPSSPSLPPARRTVATNGNLSSRSRVRVLNFISFLFVTVAVVGVLSGNKLCHALPTPDEETFSREYAKELTGWLAALGPLPPVAPLPMAANPCPHYNNIYESSSLMRGGPGALEADELPPVLPYFMPIDKRNSELINSLLTLPKQLNEVGK